MESREAFDVDVERYWTALKRSWLLATGAFLAVSLAAWAFTTRLKPSYEVDAKLLFRVDRTPVLTGLEQGGQEGELRSLLVDQSPLNSEIEILTSRPLLQQVINRLDLRDDEGNPLETEALKSTLEAKIVGAADVIQIAYVGNDPSEAVAVVNTLMSLYVDSKVRASQEEALAARDFILAQLPITESNVRQAETNLRRFREANRVVALDEQASSAVSSLGNLNDQIIATQATLQKANGRVGSLKSQLKLTPEESVLVGAINQSPAVQQALTELQQVERQLVTERTRFSDASPVVARLKQKQRSLQDLLQQEIRKISGQSTPLAEGLLQVGQLRLDLISNYLAAEVERTAVQQELAALQSSRSQYQRVVNAFPRLEQEQRELERQLDAAQSTYETLLTRKQELQVKERQPSSDVEIIEPAVLPRSASSGDKIKVLGLGIIGGSLLAISIVILSDIQQTLRRRRVYGQEAVLISDRNGQERNGQEIDNVPEKTV